MINFDEFYEENPIESYRAGGVTENPLYYYNTDFSNRNMMAGGMEYDDYYTHNYYGEDPISTTMSL